MKQHGFVAVVFIIGCAAGGVASHLTTIPPARAGTNPTRWEYLCQENNKALTSALNQAGREGWELVSMVPTHQSTAAYSRDAQTDMMVMCFKRPLA